MLTPIIVVDVILFVLLGLWAAYFNYFGTTEQAGGAGFVAFFLGLLIAGISVAILAVSFVIKMFWG